MVLDFDDFWIFETMKNSKNFDRILRSMAWLTWLDVQLNSTSIEKKSHNHNITSWMFMLNKYHQQEERTKQYPTNDWLISATNDKWYVYFFSIVIDSFEDYFGLTKKMVRQRNGQEKSVSKSIDIEPERLLVHKLVDSSKAQRSKALQRLKTWINKRTLNRETFFTRDDLIKIWKGLYYNMWMADKPALQVKQQQQHIAVQWIWLFFFLPGSIGHTDIRIDTGVSWRWSSTTLYWRWFRHVCSRMVGNRSLAFEQIYDGKEKLNSNWVSPPFSCLVFSLLFTWIIPICFASKLVQRRNKSIHENVTQQRSQRQWKSIVWRIKNASDRYLSRRIGENCRNKIETETFDSVAFTIFQHHQNFRNVKYERTNE